MTSAEYTAAFEEVKSLGAAGSTTRTAEQSDIAQFWYGTTGTFTSVGYRNQIAQEVAVQSGDSMVQNARLFALLNLAQADAYFAIWDAKYTYDFWRPVTAIRAADTDGNPDTTSDPAWTSFKGTPPIPLVRLGPQRPQRGGRGRAGGLLRDRRRALHLEHRQPAGRDPLLPQLLRGGARGERQPRLRRHPLALRRHGRGGPRIRGRPLRRRPTGCCRFARTTTTARTVQRPGPPSPRRPRSHRIPVSG